jgi:hypothetical protein
MSVKALLASVIHVRISKVFTLQLHKNILERRLGVLENLYSGILKRFATAFSNISQKSPQGDIACYP